MADLTVSFELYNEETVRILKEEDPDLLPDYSVNSSKDLAYNKKQVTSAITSGIIKGESIPKIASNLQSTIKSLNQTSAVRAARTAAIAAQNTGSLSSMKRLAEMGVEVQKEWVATLDVRTRPSHRALDGQRRDLDEAFSNGLQYPGASGNPAERWNCRCKIKAYMPKYDSEDEPRLTYSKWKANKENFGSVLYNKSSKNSSSRSKVKSVSGENFYSELKTSGIEYNQVTKMSYKISENEIIKTLAKDDPTIGSCVSIALAYCGRKAGYEVTDFRGGDSLLYFARNSYDWIKKTTALNTKVFHSDSVYNSAVMALSSAETGNEYLLLAGEHAAIIRRANNGKLQYLEMQTEDSNGWTSFKYRSSKGATTVETLNERFSCNEVDGDEAALINIENFKNVSEFQTILGYINTGN